MADAADHTAWNNLPVAAGGVCGKHGADRFGAAAAIVNLCNRADLPPFVDLVMQQASLERIAERVRNGSIDDIVDAGRSKIKRPPTIPPHVIV